MLWGLTSQLRRKGVIMSATIRLADTTATIDGWEWTSEREELANMLNALLDPAGPSGADPAPDVHAAEAAIEIIGGELVEFDEPEFVRGRIY